VTDRLFATTFGRSIREVLRMSSADPVATLLDVQVGDEVELVAEQYDWSSPFTVADVEDVAFDNPAGGWRARELELESVHALGSDYQLTIVEGRDPPRPTASHGALVDATIVERADERDYSHPPSRDDLIAALQSAETVAELADLLDVSPSTALHHIGKHDLEDRIGGMTSSREVTQS